MRYGVLLALCAYSVIADTLRIPIITQERFPGQPSEKRAIVGLPPGRSFARLTLFTRLNCPCGPGLGEWDYTVRFFATRPTGQRDSTGAPILERIEIARFITPYAANRPSNWQWTWQWDITDYRFLFTDSTEVVVAYQGWTHSALFTVWLEAIEGVPPYEVFALDQVIDGSFPYGNPADPIDRYTTGKQFRVPADAQIVKLRITTTGHGFGGTDNAAEFADKTHTVVVNTTATYAHRLWRDDCGWNPVYPQDGTWPLARAGWCPGDVVRPWERWITGVVTPGAVGRLDYRMQPFVNEQFSAHPSSYLITAQLLYARTPAMQRRAMLAAIETPTDDPMMRRLNPSCGKPAVIVRNAGRDSIASVLIEYAFDGGPVQSFRWQALQPLALDQQARIELPTHVVPLDTPAVRRLDVSIRKVNDQPNEETLLSNAVARFSDVPTLPGDSVVVYFKTNRSAREQGLAWTLRRLDDDSLIAERRNLDDETTDIVALALEDGCYQFRFDNPAGYGLAWWATAQQLGGGALWISARGKRVFTLEGDCGNGYIYNFRIGAVPQINVPRDTVDFGATPVGVPVYRRLVIKPATGAALQIKQLQVSSFPANLGFRIASIEPMLPPEGIWLRSTDSLTVMLEYSPPQEETRVRTAALVVNSNDYDEPSIRIPMRGTTPTVTGVEYHQAVEWSIAPIPARERVIVKASVPIEGCRIVTLDGRQIAVPQVVLDRGTVELDCSELSVGVYAVIVRWAGGQQAVPFIVVR